jgi:hypothetical protein
VGASTAWLPAADGVYRLDLTAHPPKLIGPSSLPGEGANDVRVDADLMTLVSDRGRLATFDVSGATPSLRADVDVSLAADAIGVSVVGDRVFVAAGSGGLRAGQLHDLATHGRGYQNDVRLDFEDVAADGDLAYVADWFFGLRVYDVSDPAAPKKVGELGTDSSPGSIAYADHKVYLADSTGGGSLRVIDVSDPTHPAVVGSIATASSIWDLQVVGNRVYTSDQDQPASGGLRIYDVSNASAPVRLGEYTGCANVRGVGVTGTIAVIGCGQEAQIIDVSDPAAPKQVGTWPLADGEGETWTILAAEGRAYIGDDVGVTVIDVSTPATPALVVKKTTPYTVRGLTLPLAGRLVAAAGLAGVFQWQIP